MAGSAGRYKSALASGVAHVEALLDKWASKKHSNVNPLFFNQLFERQPAVAWALAPKVVAHAAAAPSDFHRTTCFEMMLALVRQTGVVQHDPALLVHAHAVMEGLPAAMEAAASHATQCEDSSKKVTKMVQAMLALAMKCMDLEQALQTTKLDRGKLSLLASSIEASAVAARAKSVKQAAARLKQRTAAGSAGAQSAAKADGRKAAAKTPAAKTPSKGASNKMSASKGAPESKLASAPRPSAKKQRQ